MRFLFAAVMVLSLNLISTQLMANGIGFYVTGTKRNVEWVYLTPETDSDISGIGLGIVFDSNVAYDMLFNNRIQAGYSSGIAKYENSRYSDIKYSDFHFYHSFGFGIVREENIRFWIGPLGSVEFGIMPPISTQYRSRFSLLPSMARPRP